MDNYVIRVERRDENDTNAIMGSVELPENGGTLQFRNLLDLMEILNSIEDPRCCVVRWRRAHDEATTHRTNPA